MNSGRLDSATVFSALVVLLLASELLETNLRKMMHYVSWPECPLITVEAVSLAMFVLDR